VTVLSTPACCDAAGVALFTGPRPRDVRAPDDYVSKLVGHQSEVLGLKWSYDNRQLASGGNDGQLFIWSANSTRPILRYTEHSAAGAYTRPLFNSTSAVSDTKYTLNTP
jgi:WD40 repeat protein